MSAFRSPIRSFSLIEVVMAVAIFAVAVTALLGLLPTLTRQSATSNDTLVVRRLPDALAVELKRLAVAGGIDALAVEATLLTDTMPATCQFVATRDGGRLHSLDYLPPLPDETIEAGRQYFLLEIWSFPAAPLAYQPGAPTLALHVRASWPYRLPGSDSITPLANRERVSFNLGFNR